MMLPAARLSILRGFSCAASITAGLRGALLGQVLVLPAELPPAEREEIVDLLALFLDDLPIHVAAVPDGAPRGHLCVITEPVDEPPERVPLSALVCVRRRAPGQRRLDLPPLLSILRDAVVECLGRRHSGTALQLVAAWAGQASDSPSLALRFASAALGRHLADPEAPAAALFAAGLAATIGWLLRGLDTRVAEWALARALPAKRPGGTRERGVPTRVERLVGTEAAILGEDAALRRAFEAGLIEALPDEPDDALDLRRPLHLLGLLDEAPMDVDFALIAGALRGELAPQVYLVVDRMLRSTPAPLRLTGPARPRNFVGRDEILQRLVALCEPANEVRTTILYGVLGSGRTATAAALCELLPLTMEPVWITFAGGPEAGWLPVANALGLDLREIPPGSPGERTPAWVRRAQDRLRERACLLVVTDVDGMPEDDLPAWLPAGPGECAVLVLSATAQRWLQREQDAIAVALGPLPLDEAREILVNKAPDVRKTFEILSGDGDALLWKLDGHPGAIGMAAALLKKRTLDEVNALVGDAADPIQAIVTEAIDALDPDATKLARALAVCAVEGSPRALPAAIAGVGEHVIDQLRDRALLVETQETVRVHGLARLAVTRELGGDDRKRLEEAHTSATTDLLRDAQQRHDQEAEDALYVDALLALERMTERCRVGDTGVLSLLIDLADLVDDYPRGNHVGRVSRVIAAYQVALSMTAKELAPREWARMQNNLGTVLSNMPSGVYTDNLRLAIDAYRAALTVFTRENHPLQWCKMQNNLGVAFSKLPTGDREEHLRASIDAYRSTLTIWTRESHPTEWAMVQNHLGSAIAQLQTGDVATNLREAIAAFRETLTVYTPDSHPKDWARAQQNLGSALSLLQTGDRAENLRLAIGAFQAALTILTRDAYPRDWAAVQSNLGHLLTEATEGEQSENLRLAVEAFRAAVTIRTKDSFPWEWAATQSMLALALSKLTTGDRVQNLRDAAAACRAALTVITRDAYPNDHARLQQHLDETLAALEAARAPE